jgi:hypothetical protein
MARSSAPMGSMPEKISRLVAQALAEGRQQGLELAQKLQPMTK